jgi:hypothetical protein
MAMYDAGDARLRIVPDASQFRKDLDTQMRGQLAEFSIQVRADVEKAREDIDKFRDGQRERPVHVRVQTETARAREEIDRMRVEQESRPMDIRVNVDETAVSRFSRAVENARRAVERANDGIIASDRRVANNRLQAASANAAIVQSERGIESARRRTAQANAEVDRLEQKFSDARENRAAEINPLLIAAENALERARAKGDLAGIARNENNLNEMRKALGSTTEELTKLEESLARAKFRAQQAESAEAQAVDSDANVRRRAQQVEASLAASIDDTTRARQRATYASQDLVRTVDDEIKKSRDLSRELSTLGKDFEKAFPVSHLADAFSDMAPVIGMLPAMALGVVAAVQQLAGASLALPGIFAGVGASLATLLVGVHGVGEAYKALGTDAAQSGEESRQHAIEVRQANEQLTTATREQGDAERERSRAVRDSRQEMEDLNLQLRGGQIDTAEAVLEAQKARRDLATGHFKDGLDRQEAQLRVLSADQRVAESTENQNKLRTRQADIGDRVTQADDRLAGAHQRVAQAQERVNDVNTKVSASQRALNTVMAQLSPNAQEFAKTIFDLVRSGPLKELQTNTSQNLFAGMSTSLKTLVASDLPTLKTGMGAVATSMNSDFKTLFGSLGNDSTKNLLTRIFGDTAQAQTLLKTSIDPIIHAVGTLAAAGADTLPRLADGMGKAADRFNAFISAADKDGRLDKWINDGLTGFTELGNILINIGQSVNGVSKALGGEGLLKQLEDGTKKLADFLNSTKGRDDLRKLFEDGKVELQQIKPILEALPGIFGSVFGAARDAVGGWIPLLNVATGLLKDFPGLTQGVAEGFLAWKSLSPVFTVLGDGLNLGATKLRSVQNEITNTRLLADREMSTTATIFQKVAGEEGVGKLAGAVSFLSSAAGPLAALTSVGIPLVMMFVEKLHQGMNDAANYVHAVQTETDQLISTLDKVTNMTGTETRKKIADELTNYNPSDPAAARGNALGAAESLGIGGDSGQDLISGVLPGGENLYQKNMNTLRGLVRKQVDAEITPGGIGDTLTAKGITPDVLTDALLGEPGALKKVREATGAIHQDLPGWDLEQMAKIVVGSGGTSLSQALLVGQSMNFEKFGAASAVSQATASQAAAVPQPHLKPEFVGEFGSDAVVSSDGKNVAIVSKHAPTQQEREAFKASGTAVEQGVPPNADKWTYSLSGDDARKYTFKEGGATPHATGPLPDGGYQAVIHPSEWVSNKTGRQTLGDDFLGAANQGKVDLSLLPHFDPGGPGDVNPQTGDPLGPTGPSPDSGGGIMSALMAGTQNVLGNLGGNKGADATPGPGGNAGADATPGPGNAAAAAAKPDPFLGMPGLFGLIGAGRAADPAAATAQWGQQTMGWLANWGANTLGSAATTLYSGALDFFGLGKSVLSPSNKWTQDGLKFGTGMLDRFGGGGVGTDVDDVTTGKWGNLLGLFGGLGGANPAVTSVINGQPAAGSTASSVAAAGSTAAVTGGSATPTGDMVAANPNSRANIQLGGTTTAAVQRAGLSPLYKPGTTWDGGAIPAGSNIPPQIAQLAKQFGLTAKTDPHGSLHSAGFAFDFSPSDGDYGPAGRDRMDSFASFIKNNLSSQTLELIHYDPGVAAKEVAFDPSKGPYWGIAGAQDVDHPGDKYQSYFTGGDEGYSGHSDHVHWATDVAPVFTQTAAAAGTPATAANPAAGRGGAMSPALRAQIAGGDLKTRARAMYLQSGMPPGEWSAFDQLIDHESGWKATAQNPSSSAYGLGQFLNSTWASVGGSKTDDPMQQLPYIFAYLKSRPDYHGSPAAAWSLWQSRSPHWYDTGGNWPTGTLGFNASGHTETVLNGPQSQDVHQAITTAAQTINNQSQAQPQAPQARHMQPGIQQGPDSAQHMLPPTPQPTQAAPGGPAGGKPAPPAALSPLGPASQQAPTAPQPDGAGPQTPQGAWTPGSGDHVLPAIKTGIMSGASTLGNLAGMAASAAAAAGTFGAAGAAGAATKGLPGGGKNIGSMVAGLFNEGGKIAVDIANIPSSLMVGTLTPGTTANASGQTYHPPQQAPAVASRGGPTYNLSGTRNLDEALDAIKLKESQEQQSHLANYRAWP